MYKVTKEFTFDMAHRLINYEGPCAELHGHTYTAVIEYATKELDSQGFVLDFSTIKNKIKGWVDQFWDHGTMLNSLDPLSNVIKGHTKKIYLLNEKNPSAENIAEELYGIAALQINARLKKFKLESITIKETPTSRAIYKPDPIYSYIEQRPKQEVYG